MNTIIPDNVLNSIDSKLSKFINNELKQKEYDSLLSLIDIYCESFNDREFMTFPKDNYAYSASNMVVNLTSEICTYFKESFDLNMSPIDFIKVRDILIRACVMASERTAWSISEDLQGYIDCLKDTDQRREVTDNEC